MFWTAVVYGAGASLGACVGLFTFAFLFGLFLKEGKDDSRRIAEESLAALRERNRLTTDMFIWLEQIAVAIDRKSST